MCMRKSLIMLTWVLSKFEVRDNWASGWELHTLFMISGLCLSFSNFTISPPPCRLLMEMIFLLPEVCHFASCQEESFSIRKMTHLFPSVAIWFNYALCLAPGEPERNMRKSWLDHQALGSLSIILWHPWVWPNLQACLSLKTCQAWRVNHVFFFFLEPL